MLLKKSEMFVRITIKIEGYVMKKLNKIIIWGLAAFLIALPMSAQAATLKLDNTKRTNEKGVLRFPLIVEVKDGEKIENIDADCNCGGDLDSECKFEKKDGSQVLLKEKTFSYFDVVDGKNVTSFPAGSTEIGYLVITNNLASQRSITFSVTSKKVKSEIENNTVSISAKEAEREKSHDATLKTLKPSQGTMTPAFNPNTYEYTVYNIADTINSVNLNFECNASQCDPQVVGASGRQVRLQQGENRVEVVVGSEAGDEADTKTYVLNIIRGESGYNSAKLASLSFGDYTLTPAFKSDVTEYSLMVPNNITSVVNVLKFEKADSKAKETLNGFDNFIVGENKATITIDNVNGDETVTYTINITRMSDTDIEVLKYKNNEITFRDSDGIQVTLNEDDFKKQYADEWEKIENNTYKFDEDGNIVVEGTEEPEKKVKKKKNNTWVIVIIIVVGLIIIGVSGFFIFKKKKPTDKDKSDSDNSDNLDEKNDSKDDETKESTNDDIDETNVEEEIIKEQKTKENNTMDIDEALVDLMSTRKYEFKDEDLK